MRALRAKNLIESSNVNRTIHSARNPSIMRLTVSQSLSAVKEEKKRNEKSSLNFSNVLKVLCYIG